MVPQDRGIVSLADREIISPEVVDPNLKLISTLTDPKSAWLLFLNSPARNYSPCLTKIVKTHCGVPNNLIRMCFKNFWNSELSTQI